MADGLQIRTSKDYPNFIDITLRIPKEVIIPVDKKDVKRKVRRSKKSARQTKEFTEDSVLEIAEQGMKDYKTGKLESYEKFILREYPQYAKYLH